MRARARRTRKDPGLSVLQLRLMNTMFTNPTDWPRTFNWVSRPGKRHWLDAVILALLRRGLVRQTPGTAPGWFLTPEGEKVCEGKALRTETSGGEVPWSFRND